MSEQIEQLIQAKGLNAPRIKPADLEAEIASEHYFTAGNGIDGRYMGDIEAQVCPNFDQLKMLTFCVLVLKNGFTVTGESACASPENFNPEVGRARAREKAVEKLWPLLGFRLRDKLAAG